jgi:4-aminobutyrate aminotransferase
VKKVREICDEYGILLIFDEVQTGFGRTGEWFAAQYFDVTPDIMAIAKGIASGLPLSATVASKELMKQWPIGSHGTTFGGNPIACSVARTTLEIFHEENLVENSRVVGAYAREQLLKMKEKYSIISDVRSAGLMIGIELSDPKTGEVSGEAVGKVLDYALEEGVLFYLCGNEGEVIRMIPPLTVTKEQIDDGLQMLEKAIQKYLAE